MARETVLKTKLFIPPLREAMVSRPRLVKLIDKGIKKKVLFISAPAGFGKSTLMVEWAARSKMPVAWVSLDSTENDPVTFLSYLVSAVQSIYQDLGESILGVLASPGRPLIEPLLHAWINEITEHTDGFVLILDDFHHIQSQAVINVLGNLIDHQPAQLHLLVTSRADLPISYSRFRTRGELTDLGISDLRFTTDETFTYLSGQLGEKITEREVRTLAEKTEGWIAGLQLAVLSMKASEDISQYVAQFSAQNRYITDYLLDEVILRQPEEVQRFLFATSILHKFTAPLCNEVVGVENSQEIIEYLEHSGLFMIPLDSTRTWYRYHHLFAELLRNRLEKSRNFAIDALHKKASDWFAAQDMLAECIEHAFVIKNYPLIIKRIEDSLNQIIARGQFRNYLTWIEEIPSDHLKEKPRLEIVKIFMLHEMGRLAERDRQLKLRFVDDLVGPLPNDLRRCSTEQIINYGILAAIKTIIYASAYFRVDEAYKYAAQTDSLLSQDYMLWRVLASSVIPFMNRALGDYEKAIEGFNKVLELCSQAGFIFLTFVMYSGLSKAYLETGKLKLAIVTCQKALDLDLKYGASLPFTKLAYLIMGELMYQAGRLRAAESYVERGLEHVIRHGEIFSVIDGYSTLVRIQLANADEEQALALIREMKKVIGELHGSNNAMKIANTWEAYAMISTKRLAEARKWMAEPAFDDLEGKYVFDQESYAYIGIYRVSLTPIKIYSDFIRLTSAKRSLALGQVDEALTAIDELLLDITQAGRVKHRIEAMIVRSILLQKLGRPSEAVRVFQESVRLAAEEGFVQIFLNEGVSIRELLEQVKETGTGDIEEQIFVLQLLERIQSSLELERGPGRELDQLTQREIEVLKCLASGASYSETAEKLSITRNTLKTHTKRIYQKLKVSGLLPALNRAKELNILK